MAVFTKLEKKDIEEFLNLYEIGNLDTYNEILDGIETYVVNGHTHGQQLIKVKGDGETLVFCSDLIPLKSHFKIPWIMGYDLNAELTLKEKE